MFAEDVPDISADVRPPCECPLFGFEALFLTGRTRQPPGTSYATVVLEFGAGGGKVMVHFWILNEYSFQTVFIVVVWMYSCRTMLVDCLDVVQGLIWSANYNGDFYHHGGWIL